MTIKIPILLISFLLLVSSCKNLWNPENFSGLEESNLPVSNSVPMPIINESIGVENGTISITWTACNNAVLYELEQSNSGGVWTLGYSGSGLSYGVGTIPSGVSISFRVRAVYSDVVSQWSQVITN
jgi:hypothetical protein